MTDQKRLKSAAIAIVVAELGKREGAGAASRSSANTDAFGDGVKRVMAALSTEARQAIDQARAGDQEAETLCVEALAKLENLSIIVGAFAELADKPRAVEYLSRMKEEAEALLANVSGPRAATARRPPAMTDQQRRVTPRDLLTQVMAKNPKANHATLFKLFLEELRNHEDADELIETIMDELIQEERKKGIN